MTIVNDITLVVAPQVTVVPTTVHPTSIPHIEKPKQFNRIDFKRTILNLTKFLNENILTVQEEENSRASLITLDVWKHSDFLYKN